MDIEEFDYQLPNEAIAQVPVEPRDAALLLDTRDMSDHRFRDLVSLLAPGDLLVINDTRVRAARLFADKDPGGGKVEVLLLDRMDSVRWSGLVRPARRVRPGTRLVCGSMRIEVLTRPTDGMVTLAVEADTDIEEAIAASGVMPLPPYIQEPLDDPDLYQTVYAASPGSAAAPTAGLHFTPELLEHVADAGIDVHRIELRVGIGTFRPIATDRVEDHRMHAEWVSVPAATVTAVEAARARGGRVVAVGTTVVRALESRVSDGRLQAGSGSTDLFIRPGFRFQVVDLLVTNFHLPRSSLLVMLAAFMGPTWRDAYTVARERGYRFLSFGDAMLAARERA